MGKLFLIFQRMKILQILLRFIPLLHTTWTLSLRQGQEHLQSKPMVVR